VFSRQWTPYLGAIVFTLLNFSTLFLRTFFLLNATNYSPRSSSCTNHIFVSNRKQVSFFYSKLNIQLGNFLHFIYHFYQQYITGISTENLRSIEQKLSKLICFAFNSFITHRLQNLILYSKVQAVVHKTQLLFSHQVFLQWKFYTSVLLSLHASFLKTWNQRSNNSLEHLVWTHAAEYSLSVLWQRDYDKLELKVKKSARGAV